MTQPRPIRDFFSTIRERNLDDLRRFLADEADSAQGLERRIKGQTALHLAAALSWNEGVRELLEAGAEVDSRNDYRQTPLHVAADNQRRYGARTCPIGSSSQPVIETLLHHGADLEAVCDHELTPLATAVAARATDLVRLLLSRGAEVHAENYCGETPLCSAAESGFVEIAELLLQAGALPVDVITAAAYHGHVQMVELLASHGADLDEAGETYEQPVHAAARNARADVVELLVKLGADPAVGNFEGQTALHLAAESRGARSSIVLLAKYCDLEARDDLGRTALHCAATAVDDTAVAALLELGGHAGAIDRQGNSTLNAFFADLDCFSDKEASRLLRRLVKAGADPALANKLGRSPLDIADEWQTPWLSEALRRPR